MLAVDVLFPGQELPAGAEDHIRAALRHAHFIAANDAGSDREVTVLLTGRGQISELHERYFGDPCPTDVISFPSGEAEGQSSYLGDIAICVDVAAEQAADAGHSATREMVYLALHGLLHLLGWSDATPDERGAMLRLQDDLLRQYENECGSL